MKDAGAESPFYQPVENQSNAVAPDHSWPAIELTFAGTEEVLEFALHKPVKWEPTEQKSIMAYVPDTQEKLEKLGTRTWAEAVQLARNGWPEGRRLMTLARSQHINSEKVHVKSLGYDVAGAFPDVPRFLAGDPEHMIDIGASNRKSKPIIRVVVSPMCPISVTAPMRANWGAALLSWISAEELAGNIVEIQVIYVTNAPAFYENEGKWGPPVVVKYQLQSTNRYKSIDQLAFWMMHPAAHQRIQFAVREKLDLGKWYKFFHVYGKAVIAPDEIQKYVGSKSILLVLGNGSANVDEGLKAIEAEVERWKKRRSQEEFATQSH